MAYNDPGRAYIVVQRCCIKCYLDCVHLKQYRSGEPMVCTKRPLNFNQQRNKDRTKHDWRGLSEHSKSRKGKP